MLASGKLVSSSTLQSSLHILQLSSSHFRFCLHPLASLSFCSRPVGHLSTGDVHQARPLFFPAPALLFAFLSLASCKHKWVYRKLSLQGIPKSFLRRYGKDLSGLVLLKVTGGLTWPVKLEKSDDDVVWLWKGWRKFTEHYSIGHGHLLVFKYEGDSVFRVIIFDKSASEIDYPSRIESYGASPEGECLSRKEENVVEIEDSEGFAPRSWPSSNGSSREFGGVTCDFPSCSVLA